MTLCFCVVLVRDTECQEHKLHVLSTVQRYSVAFITVIMAFEYCQSPQYGLRTLELGGCAQVDVIS